MKRHSTVLGLALIAFMMAPAEPVSGNGREFFPAASGKAVELVYFGRIKDKTTGRLIRDRAFLTIFEGESGMTFPFTNDAPAHYRSPDIGAAVRELGGTRANPKRMEIQLMVSGYKDVRLTTVPSKPKGAVELNLYMEPVASTGEPAAASTSTRAGTAASDVPAAESPWIQIFVIGAGVVFIAGLTARTLGPLLSRGR